LFINKISIFGVTITKKVFKNNQGSSFEAYTRKSKASSIKEKRLPCNTEAFVWNLEQILFYE